MKYIIQNEQDMQNLVVEVLSLITRQHSQRHGAYILALNGDLGAGKTTFTKALAKELGITEHITSPTFVIQKSYTIPKINNIIAEKLIHIDAYRLKKADDVKGLDFSSTALNPDNIIIIEWAENIQNALPEGVLQIYFEYITETTRTVVIDAILE